ncbi:hypothetical protein WMY93_018445 [Mugilogobius chulae]|uniref:G-protein coupled receptors family 1 profile domain-containing protein n=1 Tax=Mugilogobius chulae TaxID=88201 RepID=A0AAW0NQR7_9GOBI
MSGVSPFRRHNSTPVSSFVLSAYSNPGSLRWLFFCVLLLLYLLMVFSNLLLIVVIALNRTLHEPMYLLLCSLFLNELYGSAALFPFLLVHILRDVHLVPAHFCFFQIYVIHSYGAMELLTLASMSYDRYVAICQPLHYKSVMSRRKTTALVLFPWLYGLIMNGVMISLSSSLELCSNVINKVYCDNYSIVKQACYDTSAINQFGIVAMFNTVMFPFVTILFSYARILRVCQRGSRHTWHKAVHTCSPHLASLLNFTVAAFFEIIQSRFDMSHVPNTLRVFLSLYFLLCQPLFNPLIYGLVLTKIRLICKVKRENVIEALWTMSLPNVLAWVHFHRTRSWIWTCAHYDEEDRCCYEEDAAYIFTTDEVPHQRCPVDLLSELFEVAVGKMEIPLPVSTCFPGLHLDESVALWS